LLQLDAASIDKPNIHYPYRIFPLRLIKQVITMFFSLNNPGFARKNNELVSFVLNKEEKYINPKYKIYAYLVNSHSSRHAGFCAISNPEFGVVTFSELSFFPFGFVFTIDSYPPDKRLVEITHFTRYGYNEFDIHYLNLPLLETHLFFPGDYRTKKEIYNDFDKNKEVV
jgi:hypothetical protein